MSTVREGGAIWALVPVKALASGKSRLEASLPTEQRIALQRAMLEDVLAALLRSRALAGVAVVTRDPAVAAIAHEAGAEVIAEPEASAGLNAALAAGAAVLAARGAAYALVVPADVPLLDPSEVDTLVAQVRLAPSTLVVPSRDRSGTNGLLVRLDPPPVFRFGEDSHRRHLEGAHGERAVSSAVSWPAASFALDIDTPDDLAALRQAVSNRPVGAIAERTAAWVGTQDTCVKACSE